MNSKIGKRVYYFDLLKIISIGIIFIYHVMMDMYVIHPMHNMELLSNILLRPNVHLGMLACAIFIFISGATLKLNERNESILSFYKRRMTKILIPFYIAYIIYFIIRVITFKNIHIFSGIPKWRFIYTILGIDEYLNAAGIKTFSLGVGEWFLGCILLCYLFYPLLSYLDKKHKIPTFIAMTIYYILINVFYDKLNIKMPQHFNVVCQVYNFYIGIFLVEFLINMCQDVNNDEDIEVKKKQKLKKILMLCGLLLVLFFYFYKKVINIADNIKITILLISVVLAFSNIEKYIREDKVLVNILEKFSVISFEFFLVHHFVIYEVDYLLGYRKVGGLATVAIILGDIIITILLANLIQKISKLIKIY